jgi:hypothetical protein
MSGGAPRDEGLTLVELMVTLLLAALLTSGLFFMLSGQGETYAGQRRGLEVQTGVWGAMEYLQRQLRLAGHGFGGCPGGAVVQWDRADGTKPSPYVGLRVHNGCDLLATPPAACPSAASPDAPDSFSVAYSERFSTPADHGVPLAKAMPTTSAVTFVRIAEGFQKDDLVVLREPGTTKACVLLRLTADPQPTGSSYSLQHQPDGLYNPPGGRNIFPAEGYSLAARVARLGRSASPGVRHFAVDRRQPTPRLVTWTSASPNPAADVAGLEVVAEGVEDLQIAWACDADDDGELTEGATPAGRRDDEWGGNVANDTPPACGEHPVAQVRLTLIGRSASPTPGSRLGHRPAAEDRPAGTVADDLRRSGGVGTYVRRVLVAVVQPTNLALGAAP